MGSDNETNRSTLEQLITFRRPAGIDEGRLGNEHLTKSDTLNPRDAEICRLYISGRTLQSIGYQFGISRERVRQILRREWEWVSQYSRHIEMSGRDQFLGVNVTDPVKKALKVEAERRGVSVSALSSETLEEMLVSLGYHLKTDDGLKAEKTE